MVEVPLTSFQQQLWQLLSLFRESGVCFSFSHCRAGETIWRAPNTFMRQTATSRCLQYTFVIGWTISSFFYAYSSYAGNKFEFLCRSWLLVLRIVNGYQRPYACGRKFEFLCRSRLLVLRIVNCYQCPYACGGWMKQKDQRISSFCDWWVICLCTLCAENMLRKAQLWKEYIHISLSHRCLWPYPTLLHVVL